MPRLKITGITNEDDAKWAAILGVEFVSVSLSEGADKKISADRAVEIRNMLPSYTKFIVDAGDICSVKPRDLQKINPAYVQLNNTYTCRNEIHKRTELHDTILIYETVYGSAVSDDEKPLEEDYKIEENESLSLEDGQDAAVPANDSNGLFQITLPSIIGVDKLNELKGNYNMENAIIEGDWPLPEIKKALPEIKKACSILQPHAWSVRSVIEKSPRRIDYNLMKKYIREISLW
jgi:hypothetical protein